jgi:outer membrane protein, adhesin transport system
MPIGIETMRASSMQGPRLKGHESITGHLKNWARCKPLVAGIAIALLSSIASANQGEESIGNLEQSIRQAIETNPEVQARWHRFLALGHDLNASRSGYMPSVDVIARTGRQDRNLASEPFTNSEAEAILIQNLFNGFRTRGEVGQARQQQLVGYYEFTDQLETLTLEAFRAYRDVLRQRELVALAEDNLRQHERVFQQISESASAGVARSVDLEQINGRLSLAEANLITEQSNLHDVSARYARIVGSPPAAQLLPSDLQKDRLPPTQLEALREALANNPAYKAAHHQIGASEAAIEIRKAGLAPTVDFAIRQSNNTHDEFGTRNSRNETSVGLELRYNLFRGGRDTHNIRSAHEEANAARDLRNKACVDLRQTLQIAYNDVTMLDRQLSSLNQHRLSSARVRTAYKQQFDIGQRTLLDVLDAENEHFQASRAYTNAVHDLQIAVARSLAAQGQLLETIGVTRANMPDMSTDSSGSIDDAAHNCMFAQAL